MGRHLEQKYFGSLLVINRKVPDRQSNHSQRPRAFLSAFNLLTITFFLAWPASVKYLGWHCLKAKGWFWPSCSQSTCAPSSLSSYKFFSLELEDQVRSHPPRSPPAQTRHQTYVVGKLHVIGHTCQRSESLRFWQGYRWKALHDKKQKPLV